MQKPPIPADEEQRLQALHQCGILDTAPEPRFDRIVRIAQQLLGTKITLVSLVDTERQWFKSLTGLEARETARDISFCGHAILAEDILEIPNALNDERFFDNPLVTGEPHIRFYAGAPLSTSKGFRIGTLCIIDDKPRQLTANEKQALRDLADCIQSEINNCEIKVAQEILDAQKKLAEAIARSQAQFLQEKSRHLAFEGLLKDFLDLTQSEYGFIGDVLYSQTGAPYLKSYAITNIAWSEETRNYFDSHEVEGMEFHNMQSLFGSAILSGKPIIANDPYHDSRRGGLPPGHPPLNAFLGIPVYNGDAMVAMIGLANRNNGFDQAVIDYLQPLVSTLGQLVASRRSQEQKKVIEESLARTSHLLSGVLDAATEVAIIATDPHGVITVFNRGAELLLGYREDEIVGIHTPALFHDTQQVNKRAEELTQLFGCEISGFRTFVEIPDHYGSEEREWIYICKNYSTITVSLVVTAIRNNADEITGYLGIAHNVTELKLINLVNRQKRIILKYMAMARPRDETFKVLLRSYELIFPGVKASISLFDEKSNRLTLCSSINLPVEYCTAIQSVDLEANAWPWIAAIYSEKPVIIADIALSLPGEKFSHLALPYHLRACWVIPVIGLEGRLLGVFNLYFDVPRDALPEEIVTIQRGANLCSLLIERQLVEEELQISHQAIQSISQGVIIAGSDRLILSVNEAFLAITGYSESEVVGQNCRFLQGALTDPLVIRKISMALNQKEEISCEILNYRKDGSIFWNDLTITPMFDGKNNLIRFIGITRDITESVNAKQTIKNSEQQLRTIIETEPECVKLISAQGDFIKINSAGLAMLEVKSLEEATAYGLINFIQPQYRTAFQQLQQRVLNGENAMLEFEITGAYGKTRWLETHAAPMRDRDNNVTMLLCISRDITARKYAELAFHENMKRLNEAQHIAGIGSWEYSMTTGQLHWSDNMFRMHGIDPLQGPPDLEKNLAVYVESSKQQLREAIEKTFSQAEGFSLELELIHTASNSTLPHWVKSICRPIVDDNGKVISLEGTVQDISEHKLIHAELDQHRNYLEELVHKRTIEIAQARDQALQANNAKSQFLSSMSHELRTPMNAILGFAQLLEMSKLLSEQQQDYVHEVLKGGYHLLELINQVLDLAKIESGKLELLLQPVAVSEVIAECFSLLRPLANQHAVNIVNQDLDGYQVLVDYFRFKQVVLNLLSNAIKYNKPDGKVEVSVGEVDSGRLVISVSDTGCGMEKENICHIFEPFYRINGDQSVVEGTGIGLTITRKLVEFMGGTICVESVLNVGSRFWIELPLANALNHQRTLKIINGKDLVEEARELQCYKILYIEDNPANLKLVNNVLKTSIT
jgi:PAS domain S-box-containing protein